MLGKRIEIAVISILIIGLIGYSAFGVAIAGGRIAIAERTLDRVVSHQNELNSTFRDINTQLTTLNGSSAFDANKALDLVDRSVANSKRAAQTVADDDVALRGVDGQLTGQRWLTMVSAGGLDNMHSRVGHARRALGMARQLASAQLLDGQFWRALYAALAYLKTADGHKSVGDLSGARAELAHATFNVDHAAQLSTSPGLPSDLQSLSADLQRYAADYGKQLDALAVGDYAGITNYGAAASNDATRVAGHDIDRIGKQIDAYFQPMLDRYDREIAAATA